MGTGAGVIGFKLRTASGSASGCCCCASSVETNEPLEATAAVPANAAERVRKSRRFMAEAGGWDTHKYMENMLL